MKNTFDFYVPNLHELDEPPSKEHNAEFRRKLKKEKAEKEAFSYFRAALCKEMGTDDFVKAWEKYKRKEGMV